MLGYEYVAKTINDLKFDNVFALMGNGNLSWLCYGVDQNLFCYVPVRREDAAVSAAAGHARATGDVGLATVTHGPGLGNTFTALTAAVKDNAPIVVLIGVPALNNPTALQRMDHASFAKLAGAAYHQVEKANRIHAIIARAKHAARAEMRPQVVGIYHDMLFAKLENPDTPFVFTAPEVVRAKPNAASLAQAVDMIAAAQKPLIIAGQGASYSNARQSIEAFGDLIGAIFADTMLGRHILSGNDYLVGMVGISAHPITDKFIAETDLVIVVGASLNFSQTRRFQLFKDKKVILIENDASRLPDFQQIDLVLLGDARATMDALTDEWSQRSLGPREGARSPDLRHKIEQVRIYEPSEDTSSDAGVDPRAIYCLLEDTLPDNRLVVTDGGRVIETLHHIISAKDARSYLYGSGFASIGLGLGMAIGAGLAFPDRTLLHITGDGGFMMSSQELDTVVRSGMQMLVFVMNDSQYGSEVRHIQHMAHSGNNVTVAAAQFETPELDALARAYGGCGEVIRNADDLTKFELTPEKLSGLYLVDVRVDPNFDSWKVWSPSKFV